MTLSNSGPEPYYPIIWHDLGNHDRALAEIKRQKSADFLSLLQNRLRAEDELSGILGEEAEAAQQSIVRPQNAARGQEVFVDYYVVEDRCLAILEFPNEDLRTFDLDVGAEEIAEAVETLRLSIDGAPGRMPIARNYPWDVDFSFIDRIGSRLLPFAADLAGNGIVYFFPHGPLHNFPFHVVRDDQGEPLISKTAIAHGISRRVLSTVRAIGTHGRPEKALTVGVPAADENCAELFSGDGDFFRSLGLDVISLEKPADTTVDTVLGALDGADLIHMNCHGLFSAIDPLDSALLMSDGLSGPLRSVAGRRTNQTLTAQQLFKHRLKANMVTLRACSSGVTTVRHGDEQEGLLRALLHAGVSTCCVARWKIDLFSSRQLVRSMYRYWLVDDLPKAVALQRAQLDMLRHEEFEYYRHPFHWAPFVLVGSGY